MAYADYKFYTESFGNVVPETDFPRLAERASDFVDTMTFDRLVDGLPTNERSQKRIKKAVCSLAELMYQIELAKKNAINQASANVTDINVGNIPGGPSSPGKPKEDKNMLIINIVLALVAALLLFGVIGEKDGLRQQNITIAFVAVIVLIIALNRFF